VLYCLKMLLLLMHVYRVAQEENRYRYLSVNRIKACRWD